MEKFKALTDEQQQELLIKAKAGNTKAYSQLIESHLNLVKYLANTYYHQITNTSILMDDLIGEGNEALIDAYNSYKNDKGAKYNTYVTTVIHRRIGDFISKYRDAGGENEMLEQIESEDHQDKQEQINMIKYMHHLSENEQLVIKKHYGLEGEEPISFTEIGKQINKSKERIRQIHYSALRKLRSII